MRLKKSTNSDTGKIVSSDKILIGAFLALRQAWELLGSARVLYEAAKYSSAYGLAVFSREEIGKSKLLERYWEASVAGKPVSVEELNSGELRSHTKKLRGAGKVLSEGVFFQGIPPEPGSREEYKLVRRIRDMNVRARDADPSKTHLGRLRSFYVEMHEAGVSWWTPWTIFDNIKSNGEILEAETCYEFRRRELKALRERVSSSNTVLANSLFLPTELA
jgi:AbiV family abortive infection protein